MTAVRAFCHARSVLVVVAGLVVLSGGAVVTAGPATTADQTTQKQPAQHTLVIKTTGNPVQYTLSVSGRIRGDPNETDSVQGNTLNGRVGGVPWKNRTNDTKDTIRYSGYIETFQHRGNDIQLLLDGTQIAPATLATNHIKIVAPNASNNPINYGISVTGNATTGESTEGQDRTVSQPNDTLLQGQLADSSDSFYFTGKVSVESISKQTHVFVNGQNVTVPSQRNGSEVFLTDTSAPTDTPPSTSTATVPQTQGPTTEQGPSTEGTTVRSSSSVFGQLFRLVSGVVVGALAAAAVWYYFPRQQRW